MQLSALKLPDKASRGGDLHRFRWSAGDGAGRAGEGPDHWEAGRHTPFEVTSRNFTKLHQQNSPFECCNGGFCDVLWTSKLPTPAPPGLVGLHGRSADGEAHEMGST